MSSLDPAPWSPEAFERKYQLDPDPFRFASSIYEQSRYDTTMRALQRRHYGSAFEPGCSIGELTARLAPCCERVVAMDVSATALRVAAERCRDLDVHWLHGSLAHDVPAASFDLIVLSEVAYYFDADELRRIVRGLEACFAPEVEVVAVHWLGHSADHVLHGDDVHDVLSGALDGELRHVRAQRHDGYRLDSWVR